MLSFFTQRGYSTDTRKRRLESRCTVKAALPAPAWLQAPARRGDRRGVAAAPASWKGLGNDFSQAGWEGWRESEF